MELTALEAHAFLRQWAPLLREAGFGVHVPGWVHNAASELGLRLAVWPAQEIGVGSGSPHSGGIGSGEPSTGHFALDSLLDFDWASRWERRNCRSRNSASLSVIAPCSCAHQGRWLQIDVDMASKALQFIEKQQDGKMTLGQALRTAYGTAASESGLRVQKLTGAKWIEELLSQTPTAAMSELAQPVDFVGTLRPYQVRGLQWRVFLNELGIGCCLADDMGLGKTIQFIALLLHERREGRKAPGPTLLFAPTSVVGNWLRENERFAPSLRVVVHHGPQRAEGEALSAAAAQADVIVSSYALAHRDFDDLVRVPWWRIALDEAQKIKNPAAAATTAIRALAAPRRVALTGTPIENHLSELWSIMEMLNRACWERRRTSASGSQCRWRSWGTRSEPSNCGI